MEWSGGGSYGNLSIHGIARSLLVGGSHTIVRVRNMFEYLCYVRGVAHYLRSFPSVERLGGTNYNNNCLYRLLAEKIWPALPGRGQAMQITAIGVVQAMRYFWELVEVLFQPRCKNSGCVSYDVRATGKTILFPSPMISPQIWSDSSWSAYSMPRVLREYKCLKCEKTFYC